MELNEYAVWKVRVLTTERQIRHVFQDETEYLGDLEVIKELVICAPKGKLGRDLLTVHFDHAFSHKPVLSGHGGKTWKFDGEPQEIKLDNVIRYEDAYRGRT